MAAINTSAKATVNMNPPRNGLVRDSSGTYYTAIAEVTTEDVLIYTSTDAAIWTLDHTVAAAGGKTIEEIKIVLDTHGDVNIFVIFDSAGTANIAQITNYTGSWVTNDLTGLAWNVDTETARWANGVWEAHSGAFHYVTVGVHDSANDTIRFCFLEVNKASATLSWDEDALNADSGALGLSPYFTVAKIANAGTPDRASVVYNVNGEIRVTTRTGVGTWYNNGTCTFGTAGIRNNIIITDAHALDETYARSYLSIHFNDGSNNKFEILRFASQVNLETVIAYDMAQTQTPTSVTSIPLWGTLTSFRNATSETTDDDLAYIFSADHNAELGVIHYVASEDQVWPASYTPIDFLGDFYASKFFPPRPLACNWIATETEFALSRSAGGFIAVVQEDTGGASDEIYISSLGGYLGDFNNVIGEEDYTDTATAGDTWIVRSFTAVYEDGAVAGDSYNDDVSMRVISGAGAIGATKPEYPHYTCLGGFVPDGHEGSSSASNEYPAYTATGVGDNPNLNVGTVIVYPYYVALGTGIGISGGRGDAYQTIYDPYQATGTGVAGFLGVGTATYPTYEATGYYYWGSGSATYRAYTAVGTGPGVAAGTATGSGSVTYPAYTIAVVALANYIGTGTATYRTYTAIGTGLHDATATGIASYRAYQALGLGVSGRLGTGTAEYPAYTVVAAGMINYMTATASMYYPNMYAHGEGTADHLEVFTGRLVTSDGEAILDGNGDFIVLVDPLPAEYEVMFTAMNLKKQAVSEYHSFDFNSISRNGENIYAANADGIYIVGDSDNDDGSAILANVEKVEVDYDSPMRKRATDAYIHLKSSGTYTFASIANSGRSSQTISDTDTKLHTRKIDLAKGLIGRSLGWALSSSGVSFDVEEIEIVVDMGTRRIRRYV